MVYGRASLGRSVSQGGPVSRWAGGSLEKSSLELLDGGLTEGSGHLQSCHGGVWYGPAFAMLSLSWTVRV